MIIICTCFAEYISVYIYMYYICMFIDDVSVLVICCFVCVCLVCFGYMMYCDYTFHKISLAYMFLYLSVAVPLNSWRPSLSFCLITFAPQNTTPPIIIIYHVHVVHFASVWTLFCLTNKTIGNMHDWSKGIDTQATPKNTTALQPLGTKAAASCVYRAVNNRDDRAFELAPPTKY